MWYAPIGSVEYVRNLHNDKKIKEYLLNENRLKNNTVGVNQIKKRTENKDSLGSASLTFSEAKGRFAEIDKITGSISSKSLGSRHPQKGKSVSRKTNTNASVKSTKGYGLGKPITMKTQSALLIQIIRSYRKTALDVVSYAKNLKKSNSGTEIRKEFTNKKR